MLSNISILSVPDEGYSRNVSWALNLISTFFFDCPFSCYQTFTWSCVTTHIIIVDIYFDLIIFIFGHQDFIKWPIYSNIQRDIIRYINPGVDLNAYPQAIQSYKNRYSNCPMTLIWLTFISLFIHLLMQQQYRFSWYGNRQ